MRIHIESTGNMTTVDRVPVRVWKGKTERGVDCLVFVHRLSVEKSDDTERFERELTETLPPGSIFPLGSIL